MTAGARFGVVLALFAAIGCGRSIRQDSDDVSGDWGGSSGGGSAGTGAVGGTEGGSSGSSGARGGSGGGGTRFDGTTLLLQSGRALRATNLDGAEPFDLCLAASGTVQYTLVDWVGERAILFRQTIEPESDGELLSVALDGSECSTFYKGPIVSALSPVVDGRVVFSTVATAPSESETDGPSRIVLPATGLASVALDGSGLTVLAPSGVTSTWLTGERVLFVMSSQTGTQLYTALPDGSVVEPLMPTPGDDYISRTSGERLVVSVGNDVVAINADGSNETPLATGPEVEHARAIVGDQVLIERMTEAPVVTEQNIFKVGLGGGELVPVTTLDGIEIFVGATTDRIFFEYSTGGPTADLYSVSLDGGEPTRITDTPEGDAFIGAVGDRVIFMRYIPETELTARQTVMSARSDGSDAITLHDDATEISTIVDGRVVLLVGNPNYDLVSISAAGGDITVLSDSDREDWPVGRLRRILIVQRSVLDGHGEVLRVDVDGSGAVRLASSARYLGAVTEECGLVRGGRQYLSSCAD